MKLLLKLSLVLAALAPATVAAQQTKDEHHRTVPTEGGFLEIDSRTGAVRECTRGGDGYQCKPASQEALRSALDRVTRENEELKERLAQRRSADTTTRPALPSEEEVDRALGIMERFLRRFLGILRDEKPERT
jgi:hypothetical protein